MVDHRWIEEIQGSCLLYNIEFKWTSSLNSQITVIYWFNSNSIIKNHCIRKTNLSRNDLSTLFQREFYNLILFTKFSESQRFSNINNGSILLIYYAVILWYWFSSKQPHKYYSISFMVIHCPFNQIFLPTHIKTL